MNVNSILFTAFRDKNKDFVFPVMLFECMLVSTHLVQSACFTFTMLLM